MRACLVALVVPFCFGCGPPPTVDRATVAPGFKQASAQELFAQARARQAQGDLLGAEQYFAAAMERGYDPAVAVKSLLDVCVASSRYQSALGHAQNYLAEHPADWNLRFLVATLQQALGNTAEAKAELERVISEQPSHAPAHYALAVLLRDGLGDPAAAVERYEHYLSLAPGGEHAIEVRAWLKSHGNGATP